MRILIIEDEVRLAATLADMTGEEGYAADVANDGETGLDNALTGIYDALVLDVMLPRLDGFEVLKRLRKAGVQTPVLMLTAKSDLTDRVHGLDLGADYYLTKPFENAEFLACLRAVLRRSQAGPDAPLLVLVLTYLRVTQFDTSISYAFAAGPPLHGRHTAVPHHNQAQIFARRFGDKFLNQRFSFGLLNGFHHGHGRGQIMRQDNPFPLRPLHQFDDHRRAADRLHGRKQCLRVGQDGRFGDRQVRLSHHLHTVQLIPRAGNRL